MRERIEKIVEEVTSARCLEAAWLNTLSMMNFTAARKISRTVAESHPTIEVLRHLSVETQHAVRFKELACEVSGDDCDSYLCRDEAKRYFARLDRELSAWAEMIVGDGSAAELNYLLVTSMVERRAMSLYPIYREATPTDSVREWLREVVIDGQQRRVEIEERCLAGLKKYGITTLAVPEAVESAYFIEFLTALEVDLAQHEVKLSA